MSTKIELPVYPSGNNDPLSSKGLLNGNGGDNNNNSSSSSSNGTGLPTSSQNGVSSAEGYKKIHPGTSLEVKRVQKGFRGVIKLGFESQSDWRIERKWEQQLRAEQNQFDLRLARVGPGQIQSFER